VRNPSGGCTFYKMILDMFLPKDFGKLHSAKIFKTLRKQFLCAIAADKGAK